MRVATLVLVCAMGGLVQAQTPVFAGLGAQASLGGGTRSVLLINGQYVVFFNDGSSVVYANSLDGVTFSAPMPASSAPASFGFSVARRGNTLGLVWAHSDATGYSLWYREAAISGATLAFGAPTLVASHATETRGYLATLAYSAAGTPYIAAIEFGHTYTGPAGPGCGSTTRYRPTHYIFVGSWMMRGYCNNFDTLRDPNSLSIAPSGANMIITSALDANLSTAIVNDAVELGEPWHMVPAVEHILSAQMSSVASQTTDVHVAYRDDTGALSYARQDGTLVDLNSQMLDVTVLNAAARNPTLSRPTSATGCYVATYAVGNSIRRRNFRGSIAALSPETTAYATSVAPINVSAELEPEAAPALVWQEDSSIQFGFASAGAPSALTAVPPVAPAGASGIAISSTPFRDGCGDPLPAGTLVTVTSSVGSIVDDDASAQFAGTQVMADADGQITITVQAQTAGVALVAAMPVTGGTNASIEVTFTGSVPPGCGDGVVDATEDCETGAFCDMTTCTYEFSFGGGCAGCGASSPRDGLWIVVWFGFAIARRRRRPAA